MRVINEACLDKYRGIRVCELCREVKTCVPHHVSARGTGSHKRIDVPLNVGACCIACHSKTHNEPSQAEWESIVAAREGEDAMAVACVLALLRRLPKRPRQDQIEQGLEELTASEQRLFRKVWSEIPAECKS